VSVHAGYVVIVPSWPLEAGALVMTLDINNKMEVSLLDNDSRNLKCYIVRIGN